MTMNYDNDHSTVRINATAKGNQIEVKVVAQPIPEDEQAVDAIGRMLKGISNYVPDNKTDIPAFTLAGDAEIVRNYIKQLRSAVPDVTTAVKLANAAHLQAAAQHEIDGGEITYDPEKKLQAAWEQMVKHDAEQNA